jgi:hypothetical protein
MMYQLVYVSSAVRQFTDDELTDLIRVSRANNAHWGITGMMLYSGGNFIQALEGPEAAVRALETRIGQDPRHRGMIVLLDGPIAARQFPEWTMGFRRMEHILDASEEGQNAAWAPGTKPEDLLGDPGRALILLRSFRRTMG